jgi:hypothetical protein
MQIVIVDVKLGTVEIEDSKSVISDVDNLAGLVLPIVVKDAVAFIDVRGRIAINRHATVTDATTEGSNASSTPKQS